MVVWIKNNIKIPAKVMDAEQIIIFLVGTLQVIGIGLMAWILKTIIALIQRIAVLEGKFDAFPIAQIANNRHRIEQLEKHQELVDHKIGSIEKVIETIKTFCMKQHGGNL